LEEVINIYKQEIHTIFKHAFLSFFEWDYDWYVYEVESILKDMETEQNIDELKTLYKRAKMNYQKLEDFNATSTYRRWVEKIPGASYEDC
jgi:hypothetical protein